MVVIGTMFLALGRVVTAPLDLSATSLWLCVTGLIAVFLTGYVGYFVVDRIWPTFYYSPVPAGKNAWLMAQALSVALYWLGVIKILFDVRKVTSPAA